MMHFLVILSLFVSAVPDSAQVFQRPLSEAEILCIEAEDERASYDFSAALASYRKSLDYPADSLRRVRVDSLMAICRNGIAMSEFCYRPKVAARQRFGVGEFLDYYPLAASQRERLSASPVDTLMLVDSTRIAAFFPIESEGYVYFSSRDLPGVGGADLYRCRRLGSSAFVGEPENLGFPYSSPSDDYLLLNTPDGEFTLFASNRECSADSIFLYALVREAVPVRGKVAEGAALRTLCMLEPKSAEPATADQKRALEVYRRAEKEFSQLQDSLSRHNRELEALRRRYSGVSGPEKQFLAGEISRLEMALPSLHKKNAAAAGRLRDAEAECRKKGLQVEETTRSWKFKKY